MLPQELIRTKRDGRPLDAADIEAFVGGLVSGEVTEGQAAAFAMAVFFQGMDVGERVALTRAMTASGSQLSWKLDGPVLDKHSTGGVGDTVSLMLAPMVAACGGYVPMISGRGLGHTGGTYDKFESIPGYRAAPSMAEFRKVVAKVGCAVIGQTSDLAPADKRLYAIRDVTATVESIPLITASILSKKLAAGLDGLAMDVKFGSGAFMTDHDDARALARSIADVAAGAGLPTTALLTDMDQPLAPVAGNALEVVAAIDYLTGASRPGRLHEVVLALGVEMLLLGRLAAGRRAARSQLQRALDSGDATERFARMVHALGGPRDLVEKPWSHLERAKVMVEVLPERAGVVAGVDARAVGMAVVELGGGRTRPQDDVDHAVGLTELAEVGDAVGPERPLAVVHARNDAAAQRASTAVRAAYRVGRQAPQLRPAVGERLVGRAQGGAKTRR
ncbi:MAG: thymidine phosphorylase [Actinomycetota bacterium]|nr:MAG: thymidine phosphorylase [Actinomycetota bacterium]